MLPDSRLIGVHALAAALCLSYLIALGPPAFAAGESCSASAAGVQTRYLLHTADGPLTISGVALSGFDPATCDGQTVRVSFYGNAAGDSAASTDLLSVMDTSAIPCRRDGDDSPVVLHEGSITVRGCAEAADPHGAAFVDVHDVTSLRVQVAGAGPSDITKPKVLGSQAIQDGAEMPAPPASGDALGDTGGARLVAAYLGLAFLLLGILALARRRRLSA